MEFCKADRNILEDRTELSALIKSITDSLEHKS